MSNVCTVSIVHVVYNVAKLVVVHSPNARFFMSFGYTHKAFKIHPYAKNLETYLAILLFM